LFGLNTKVGDSMSGKCKDCEFCFPHEEYGFVCAGSNYGENISGSLKQIKDCYSEGLDAFIKRTKKEEIPFIPGTKLGQLKIDGRKLIEVTDQEGKMIRIKASNAKKMMGDVEIERIQFGDTYLVRAIFDRELFGEKKYLVIK
jgi:hypothetical protein